MLGDIDEFYLEAFKLNDISGLTGLAMDSLNLNDFGLTKWQTPSSLVKAIPQLGDLSISSVPPIRDLLSKVGAADWNEKISTIAQDKRLGNLELGKYIDLSKYSINSIPGLTQTPIGKFKAWQQSFISQVPGLSQVPFSQFPIPFASGGMSFAYTDLVWSSAEHGDSQVPSSYFISGTIDKKDRTVPVPCKAGEQCAYIELSDPVGESGPYYGKRWVSGRVQKVKGGFGPLAAVNNGWEPTGKLIYGSAFKVVLNQTNESSANASFSLYFRACARIPFYGKSCTPFFIGGVPWLPSKEGGIVVVASTKAPNVDIPSKYKEQIEEIERQNQPQEPSRDDSEPTQANQTDTGDSSINQQIINAMQQAGNFPTGTGYSPPETDNGENACAWAVNEVIAKAGITKLGGDTLAVNGIESALQNGRGERISDRSQARAGDIALIPGKHVGICLNDGCTQIKSNSSSRARFSWISDAYFSPSYGQPTRVYRVLN